MKALPRHLQKYIVEQDYGKYSPLDHAVWRFILRQLRAYLSTHAHESYLSGLEKTGIEIEKIPSIADISAKLEKFGWRALPVSGFIPPAAFMELQSLGVLPIASDMRSLEHLTYTPAPDIVHEAAGHAPIIANPEFAEYLKQYAQVAKKAIINKKDLKQYEAIRKLSDLKESASSTEMEIAEAQKELEVVSSEMGEASEAGELSRMNWWTAEYGLVGSLEKPRIFGAGLLSSVGESKLCLSAKVKKIPLTVDCIKQGYDITEPQPQLFVAKDFKHLSEVLEEMADGMAFRVGGEKAFQKAMKAETVNTIELESGLQISGEWKENIGNHFVKAIGHCQLSYNDQELPGHGSSAHSHGFSTPLGDWVSRPGQSPAEFTEADLRNLGVEVGNDVGIKFVSGFNVSGVVTGHLFKDGKLLLISFKDCKVTYQSKVYFEPSWGTFDMAVGTKIVSVFGGPADSAAYGERDDFVAARVPPRKYSDSEKLLFNQYAKLRELREKMLKGPELVQALKEIESVLDESFDEDWLLRLEMLELLIARGGNAQRTQQVRDHLEKMASESGAAGESIRDGLALAGQL